MEITYIDNPKDFLAAKDEWNDLLAATGSDTIFLCHEWLSCWWESHKAGGELTALLLRSGGHLVGAVPLALSEGAAHRLPGRKVTFMADAPWTPGDLIVRSDMAGAVRALMEGLLGRKYDIADLRNIPAVSESLPGMRKFLDGRGIGYSLSRTTSSPFIIVCSPWEEFLKGRSTKFRKTLKNKINRINKAGEVTVRKVSEPGEALAALDAVFDIGSKSWKHKTENSISSSGANMDFYTRLTEIMSKLGRLDIWLLILDGIPIAYEYHISYQDTVHALLADYDSAYSDLSPGSVLDFHIVKSLFETRKCTYDLGCGDNPYKLRWTDEAHHFLRLKIYRNTAAGWASKLADTQLRPRLLKAREAFRSRLNLKGGVSAIS